MRNVLFIVYYFPPMGSSGVQRPLKFAKYLREYGWNPIVLAPEPGYYHTFDESLVEELESLNLQVYRTEAGTFFHQAGGVAKIINSLPELLKSGIRRINEFFNLPDNKTGWIEPGVEKGMQIVKEHSIDLIFSTAPPFSNHLLAKQLKEQSQLPLVLDFRDDWLENPLTHYATRWHKQKMARLEQSCLKEADGIIALDEYMMESLFNRTPGKQTKRSVIPHGYDPADFEQTTEAVLENEGGKINFLYSGIFYEVRQPDIFLKGLRQAITEKPKLQDQVVLHFQGGLSGRHHELINSLGLQDQLRNYGYVNHKVAVQNLLKADILWMFSNQPESFKYVFTGKIFEYIGTGKPILGIANSENTFALLDKYGASYYCQPDVHQVKEQILNIYADWLDGSLPPPNTDFAEGYDRKKLSGKLADFLDTVLQTVGSSAQ